MKQINFFDNFLSFLIFIFPILIILGPLSLNFFSIFLSLYALINLNEVKKLFLSNNKILLKITLILIFIFPYNNFNLSEITLEGNFDSAFFKYFSYIRYILMCFGIIVFLKQKNHENIFLLKTKKYYLIFFIIISIDIIKELITGSNIFGFYTIYPGRIASFANEELIIGYIFCFLILFIISENILRLNKYYLVFFIFFILILSFLIGERSNFLKLSTIIICFASFHYLKFHKLNLIRSLLFLIFILILIFSSLQIMKNTPQAKKFYNMQKYAEMFNKGQLSFKKLYYENKHFAHYDAAFKIFLNYPLFGVGINNFGNESSKSKYETKKLKYSDQRSSTHPHQIYFEILAEVGLFGFLYLLYINILIIYQACKIYIREKNLDLLGHIMLHIFFIYPILPSGSFFGTNYGLPLWFNFSILVYQVYFNHKIK